MQAASAPPPLPPSLPPRTTKRKLGPPSPPLENPPPTQVKALSDTEKAQSVFTRRCYDSYRLLCW